MSYRAFPICYVMIIFFFPQNVTTTLGININVFSMLELIVGIIALFFLKFNMLEKYMSLRYLVLFVSIFCSYKLLTDKSAGVRIFSLSILCPPIIFASLPQIYKYPTIWKKFIVIYKVFFILECLISITERLLHRNILIFVENLTDNFGEAEVFRSCSMLGHPLQNALVVTTMMTFFLVSKEKYKYFYWGLGFLSLLCFETRSSIVGNLLLIGIYFLWLNFKGNKDLYQKLRMNVLLISFALIGSFTAINLGLGSRLMKHGLYDGSAQVRLDIWSIFDRYSIFDFIFGLDYEAVEYIFVTLRLTATENFWIDYLFRFGFIFICIIVPLYYKLLKDLYKEYSKFQVFLTVTAFVLIASTNNSLSAYWLPLYIYLFSIVLFSRYCPISIPTPIYIKLIFCILQRKIYSNRLNSRYHNK